MWVGRDRTEESTMLDDERDGEWGVIMRELE